MRFKYGELCMNQQKAEEFSGRGSTEGRAGLYCAEEFSGRGSTEGRAGLYCDVRSWRLSTAICDDVKERVVWHILENR